MDTIVESSLRPRLVADRYVGNPKTLSTAQNVVVPHGNIAHQTDRAHGCPVPPKWILRRQHNVCALLSESTPCVFKEIALYEYALPLLQLKIVLDDKLHTDELRIVRIPDHRLEQMIEPNFNVS